MHKNPHCSLLFFNPKKLEYVSFEGKCSQKNEARMWWRDWLCLHYPEGPNGNRFSVWELKPDKVQLVSVDKGLESSRADWRPPELVLNLKTKSWDRIDTE